VLDLQEVASTDKELLFVESGKEISYGVSIYLDAISLTKSLGAELVIVISGKEETIVDDIIFLKNHINLGR
jgi:hypothetical protein